MSRIESMIELIKTFRTGGQSGADRAVLDFAAVHRIPFLGWCVSDGSAEDLGPGELPARYPQLHRTPSNDPRQRTAWNVRDSDATLVIIRDGVESSGTAFTQLSAQLIYEKPYLVCNAVDTNDRERVRTWLSSVVHKIGHGLVLNVAGPRETEAPGIYDEATRFLEHHFG